MLKIEKAGMVSLVYILIRRRYYRDTLKTFKFSGSFKKRKIKKSTIRTTS